jgi:hypothetical protein
MCKIWREEYSSSTDNMLFMAGAQQLIIPELPYHQSSLRHLSPCVTGSDMTTFLDGTSMSLLKNPLDSHVRMSR